MHIVTEDGQVIGGIDRRRSFLGRARGLMFAREGRVLLAFDRSDRYPIWMPFMRFSIDIAFIDAEGEVVSIEKDVPPLSFRPETWRLIRPSQPCRSILEVEAGLYDDIGLEVGDRLYC